MWMEVPCSGVDKYIDSLEKFIEKRIPVKMTGKRNNKLRVKIVAKKATKKKNEVTKLGAALRALGGLGGGAVGSLFGNPATGSTIGTGLGAALSRWLGSGDYRVSSNTVVQQSLKGTSSIPSMHQDGQSVIVRHKEFVTEVRGYTSFRNRGSFDINPGRAETFPWLAGVASRFQEYKIRGLVWHYVPSSGTAVSGTSPALGTVMLQTSYRSNDEPPATKMEVLNEYWSSESVPSEAFCHPIECDPKENPFNIQYVRTDKVPDGDSKLLYDLGTTHLCVSGQQANDVVLGDLWCTYEIELKKPIVTSNVTSIARSAALAFTGTLDLNSWFNGSVVNFGTLDVTANVKTISFPARLTGRFLVTVTIIASTTFTAADLSGTPTTTNCSLFALPTGSTYLRTVMGGTTPTVNNAVLQFAVDIQDSSKTASVTCLGSFTGAATQSMVTVTPYLM